MADPHDVPASSEESEAASYPLAVAFELLDLGARMRAERHRREHPEATEADVEAVVFAWMRDRPGAPHGDCDGRPVQLPRPS